MPSIPILPDFKRGDTYQLTCTYKGDGTTASSVAAFTIAAQLRTSAGTLVAEMTITKLTQSGATLGQFTVEPTDPDTTGWPLGRLEMDLEITEAGVIRSSETMVQPVVKDVTR